MAGCRSPYTGARISEPFRQIDAQRSSNLDCNARNHILRRNQAVAEALCVLRFLRSVGLIPGDTVPTVEGAQFQSLCGSKTLASEEAHCLPCQLAIVSRSTPLGALLPNREARDYLNGLFGKVTYLPRAFNEADHAAESVDDSRLIAFLITARKVIRYPRVGQRPEVRLIRGIEAEHGDINYLALWPISRAVGRNANSRFWNPIMLLAYDLARAEIQSSGKYLSAPDDSNEVISILDAYRRHHNELPSRLLDHQMDEIDLRFNGLTPPLGSMTTGASA